MLLSSFRSAAAGAALAAALLLASGASAQPHRAKAAIAAKPATPPAQTAQTAPCAAPGTFQLVQLTHKRIISLTTESLGEIERRRQPTVEARWTLNEFAYVRILPRSVISAPGFQPLAPVVSAVR